MNNCPTLQTGGNVGYPVSGPGNLVYDSTGATSFAGCQVVNAVFSNWITSFTYGTYIGSAVTAAQSGNPLITTPTFRLATERGTFGGGDAYLDNNDGNNDWSTASLDGNQVSSVDFVATTTGLAIYQLSFTFSGVVHGTTGTVGITPIFCLGGTFVPTASAQFTAAACSSAGGTPISPGLVNIAGNGIQTLNFVLPMESNRVAVDFSVNLTPGTTAAGFNYVDLNFDEAPEPSTFLLLGSALTGLCALRMRKAELRSRT